MANKVLCACGELLQLQINAGHGLHLLIPEELTNLPTDDNTPCGALLDLIVRESSVVALCPKCGGLAVIDPDLNVKHYAPR